MSAERPKIQAIQESTDLAAEDVTHESFAWNTKRLEFENLLKSKEDLPALISSLLEISEMFEETDEWNHFLIWARNHADELLAHMPFEEPGMADLVVILFSNIHLALEDREPDDLLEVKRSKLRRKILTFFKSHQHLFSVSEEGIPYQFRLRVRSLSNIINLCVDVEPDILDIAKDIGIQLLIRGWTPENRTPDESPIRYTDLFSEIEGVLVPLSIDELKNLAKDISLKLNLRTDLHTKERMTYLEGGNLIAWICRVLMLEHHAAGCAHELHARFGISNVFNFPLKTLLKQYDMRDKQIPYGLVIAAAHDHNGSLSSFASIENLEKFCDDVSEHGVHVRIIEVGTPRELAQICVNLDRMYGIEYKISFALIRAHGNPSEIRLGSKKSSVITTHAVSQLQKSNLRKFFTPKPTIIFESCSVGENGGLAEQLADALGGITWGSPKNLYAIQDVHISGTPEHLSFTVTARTADGVIPMNKYGNTES